MGVVMVKGWTVPEMLRKIPPPNPFVAFAVHEAHREEMNVNVVDELRKIDIPPPLITFVDPHEVMFDDEIDTFTFPAVDGVVMMDGTS